MGTLKEEWEGVRRGRGKRDRGGEGGVTLEGHLPIECNCKCNFSYIYAAVVKIDFSQLTLCVMWSICGSSASCLILINWLNGHL